MGLESLTQTPAQRETKFPVEETPVYASPEQQRQVNRALSGALIGIIGGFGVMLSSASSNNNYLLYGGLAAFITSTLYGGLRTVYILKDVKVPKRKR